MGSTVQIVCDVQVPAEDGMVAVPTCWALDEAISFEASGVLVRALDSSAPQVMPARAVAELVEAGYLLPDGPNRFRLVHPARLGPMPTA